MYENHNALATSLCLGFLNLFFTTFFHHLSLFFRGSLKVYIRSLAFGVLCLIEDTQSSFRLQQFYPRQGLFFNI